MAPKTFSTYVLLAMVMAGGILFLEAVQVPFFDTVITSAMGCPDPDYPGDEVDDNGNPRCKADCCTTAPMTTVMETATIMA